MFDLPPASRMPYVRRLFFSVADFISGAHTAVAWTDKRALTALDALAAAFPAPLAVVSAFRRWPDAGRCAGLRFSLAADDPALLRGLCLSTGLFSHVSPPFFDGRIVTVTVSVPREGNAGVHVFAYQDALLQAGLYAGPLTGVLTPAMRGARLTNAPPDAKI